MSGDTFRLCRPRRSVPGRRVHFAADASNSTAAGTAPSISSRIRQHGFSKICAESPLALTELRLVALETIAVNWSLKDVTVRSSLHTNNMKRKENKDHAITEKSETREKYDKLMTNLEMEVEW